MTAWPSHGYTLSHTPWSASRNDRAASRRTRCYRTDGERRSRSRPPPALDATALPPDAARRRGGVGVGSGRRQRGLRRRGTGRRSGRDASAAPARIAPLTAPPGGNRHPPADRAHRRGDDGEPLVRRPPGHAGSRGRADARNGREAGQLQPGSVRWLRALVPHAQHLRRDPLGGHPELERLAHLLGQRHQHGLRQGERRRGHGLLGRGGPSLLPLHGPAVPHRRPLLRVRHGPDLPESPLPHRGHRVGQPPHRRVGHLQGRRPQRHDLRPPQRPRHLLEGLLPRPAELCPLRARVPEQSDQGRAHDRVLRRRGLGQPAGVQPRRSLHQLLGGGRRHLGG